MTLKNNANAHSVFPLKSLRSILEEYELCFAVFLRMESLGEDRPDRHAVTFNGPIEELTLHAIELLAAMAVGSVTCHRAVRVAASDPPRLRHGDASHFAMAVWGV